jgi:hypothetical protein
MWYPLGLVVLKENVMKEVYRETLPSCDICKVANDKVAYDMPYQGMHWANLCEDCRKDAANPDHSAGIKIIKGVNPKAKTTVDKAEKQKEMLEYAEGLDDDSLAAMVCDSVVEAADGCSVEPDGICEHGYESPLITLGIM